MASGRSAANSSDTARRSRISRERCSKRRVSAWSRVRFHPVSPAGPKKSARMLLSTPSTWWPQASKWATASEPMRPLEPVTRILTSVAPPVRRSASAPSSGGELGQHPILGLDDAIERKVVLGEAARGGAEPQPRLGLGEQGDDRLTQCLRPSAGTDTPSPRGEGDRESRAHRCRSRRRRTPSPRSGSSGDPRRGMGARIGWSRP